MNYKLAVPAAIVFVVLGYFYFSLNSPFDLSENPLAQVDSNAPVNTVLTAKFSAGGGSAYGWEYLSQNGNSSCSLAFRDSISQMPDETRLVGSCCSPMSIHRYSEQVEGLKKYAEIPEIPSDPYDIEAGLAKQLMSYYDIELSPEEQLAYDYAMQNSDEKGPCCCKCWRWNVYGGLGKLLIRDYNFTGEQVTELWNLSDGCGGDSEHHHT